MLDISFIDISSPRNLSGASLLLDKEPFLPISCNNWAELFPYTPQAGCHIAHNNSHLFVKFKVEEDSVMAKVSEDNGEVWTDSCVELFLSLDESGYYNFEFTCIGKALLGFRKERPVAVYASDKVMKTIGRLPSLGYENFEERHEKTSWELTVCIPATALFKHNLKTWKGIEAKINLYKCGNNLSKPHYLSWQPIDNPKPDFHIERCFSPVYFI